MPSGKTHDKITIFLLPILIFTLYYIGIPTLTNIIITLSYLFSSFMFNGDLDVPSKVFYRWSFLRFIWLPYQNIPHRSILSHGLIIGTLLRVLYIGIIPLIILYFSEFNLSILWCMETLYVLIGLEIGSATHSIADKIF